MNINDITIGQARELASFFDGAKSPASHPMAGKYCIIRCRDAGVWAGVVISSQGREAHVEKARRLYRWQCADGELSLQGIARAGLDQSKSRVQGEVEVYLPEICELIPCSDKARVSIEGANVDVAD